MTHPPTLVVAGHVCLDIIPAFLHRAASLEALLRPGKLVDVGPATLAAGGAVANTGLALHRLGLPTRLVGKLGCDPFGQAVLDIFRGHSPGLAEHMACSVDVATSYTVVVNPPGIDRLFLHCPGANDTFGAADVSDAALRGAGLLHFGYPPLMRRIFSDGGGELVALLRRAREAGLTTSLDLALPDPDSDAGRVDWAAFLARVLPHVDLFVPSLEELAFMLGGPRGRRLREQAAAGVPLGGCTPADVDALAASALRLGAAAVLLKLGREGACLRASADPGRLRDCGRAGPAAPEQWAGFAGRAACFTVEVAGTTGAGDCTIAGFLAAVARGLAPSEALRLAVAVGSASVERPDATSGVPPWDRVAARVAAGWTRDAPAIPFPLEV